MTAEVFDRVQVRRHRDRAAAGPFAEHDFLFRHAADMLVDRLFDMRRDFPVVADLGGRDGALGRALDGRKGVRLLVGTDPSAAMARRAAALRPGATVLVADEEALPLADASFDLIASNLSLHWVNDLPGALIQIRRALRPDGLFLATLLGGETLRELKIALTEAETIVSGGASPRVSPFTDVRDAGGLLQRAGFALPVVDTEMLTVTYPDTLRLMRDLRAMGENAAHRARPRTPPPRALFAEAEAVYRRLFAEADGRLPAQFEILTLTAWAPAATQQQPRRPGSADASLATALGTEERSAGEPARPGRPTPNR